MWFNRLPVYTSPSCVYLLAVSVDVLTLWRLPQKSRCGRECVHMSFLGCWYALILSFITVALGFFLKNDQLSGIFLTQNKPLSPMSVALQLKHWLLYMIWQKSVYSGYLISQKNANFIQVNNPQLRKQCVCQKAGDFPVALAKMLSV